MNYLKTATDKLLIVIHGYKTPDPIVKKYDLSYLIGNPPFDVDTDK